MMTGAMRREWRRNENPRRAKVPKPFSERGFSTHPRPSANRSPFVRPNVACHKRLHSTCSGESIGRSYWQYACVVPQIQAHITFYLHMSTYISDPFGLGRYLRPRYLRPHDTFVQWMRRRPSANIAPRFTPLTSKQLPETLHKWTERDHARDGACRLEHEVDFNLRRGATRC
jgi:hypothetical protein